MTVNYYPRVIDSTEGSPEFDEGDSTRKLIHQVAHHVPQDSWDIIVNAYDYSPDALGSPDERP